MKFTTFLTLALPTLTLASPTPTTEEKRRVLAKRASVTDVPETGFATQNGGTTGGRGGSTTTVSTLPEFSAAVKDDEPRIVVLSGPLTGTGSVKIGSKKTIIGQNSNASRAPPSPHPMLKLMQDSRNHRHKSDHKVQIQHHHPQPRHQQSRR